MSNKELKIYVWREWYHLCEYTHGIAMAIAKSEENAKKQILINVVPDYNETAIKHLLERNPDKTEEYFQNYQKSNNLLTSTKKNYCRYFES